MMFFHFFFKFCNLIITLSFFFLCLLSSNVGLSQDKEFLGKPKNIDLFIENVIGLKKRNLFWGSSVKKIIEQNNKIEFKEIQPFKIGNCFFQYFAPIKIKYENWQLWLCENDNSELNGLHLEKGFNGIFFEKENSKTELFEYFFKKLIKIYGSPHKHWKECHNTRWNFTEQYSWYFDNTTVTIIQRDIPLKQLTIQLHMPLKSYDYGPGICYEKPLNYSK